MHLVYIYIYIYKEVRHVSKMKMLEYISKSYVNNTKKKWEHIQRSKKINLKNVHNDCKQERKT